MIIFVVKIDLRGLLEATVTSDEVTGIAFKGIIDFNYLTSGQFQCPCRHRSKGPLPSCSIQSLSLKLSKIIKPRSRSTTIKKDLVPWIRFL